MRPLRLPRDVFVREFWHYRIGQHVAAWGPTQRSGKTELLFNLLQATMAQFGQALDVTAFCMKGRDPTAARWARALELREVPEWPPPPRWPWQSKPAGHLLWPPHTFDPRADNPRIAAEFRRAMLAGYKRGKSILFLDEVYGILAELGLGEDLTAIVTRGGTTDLGSGAWITNQKPSGTQQAGLPGFLLNCPYHHFLAPDNVVANRRRYGELSGGLDPDWITHWTTPPRLGPFEFLYLNMLGETCIVEAR